MATIKRHFQSILTGLCGVFLIISLFPGQDHAAYFAVVFGSYFAVRSAWDTIRERTIDVNILMLLAAIGAVYLDELRDAAALLFLFSLSTTLESLAMARTKNAIEGLIHLRPDRATLVTPEGDRSVAVKDLVAGDRVRVPAFESIPVDGHVLEGESEVDQAAMTGESVPVSKKPGDMLLSGTQNLQGMLVMQVESAVGDTTLDKIVSLVQEAQENKASGERISNWFGKRYTLFVVGAFVASLLVRFYGMDAGWAKAMKESLTLLVALSPCALVISTPASTLSALTWAARHGILIRGGEFIERAGKVEVVALDKTGTLTTGKPQLAEICLCELAATRADCKDGGKCWHHGATVEGEAAHFLKYAAAAEQHSSHPIADAIVREAERAGIVVPPATEHESLPGLGVRAVVDGSVVRIGQRRLFEGALPDWFIEHASALEGSGMTVALVEVDGRFAAMGLRDTARDEAPAVLAELRQGGVKRIAMLTGDTSATAATVAKELGIDEALGDLMPADKTVAIERFQSDGSHVLFVGDGINDAPSLSMASVGVAMGGLGSDIALNAADVVLMNDRLDRIPQLLKLGRRTNAVIRTNLLFAAGVILVLTLASMSGGLPLWVAVIGHEGSTVLVILNGLRLLSGP